MQRGWRNTYIARGNPDGQMQRRIFRTLGALLIGVLAGQSAAARPAIGAYDDRSDAGADHADRRCTSDGAICITLQNYIPDTCAAIEASATAVALDPHFFARLLWRESRFDPGAVSPAGALGIAQFMPGTAKILGLDDPLNPAKAIHKSARYLAELRGEFGSIGMAAVAYNGGEDRAARFISEGGGLPYETQDYVLAITGLSAEDWRDSPPESLDLSLGKGAEFMPACIELAGSRTVKEFVTPERIWPWGVIIATASSRSGAQRQAQRMSRVLRPVLGSKSVSYVRKKMPGTGRTRHTAQVGWGSRAEAYSFCQRLKSAGGRCIVLKN